MASGYGQPEKGKPEAKYESRSQAWKNSNLGRSGNRPYGSPSAGSGDQWSMAHGWYPVSPWNMQNGWSYPYPTTPQSQWGMSTGWSTMDPLAVMQMGTNSGQESQWSRMTGSTSAGSKDQWSMRTWTNQDSRSWSSESTMPSKIEDRDART
eukprot:3681539-Amphidinium_carterae.1